MKLPTVLGRKILEDMIKTRTLAPGTAIDAIAAFQRMAVVTDYDTAKLALDQWLKPEHRKFAETEGAKLKVVYNIAKQDVLGHAIDAVVSLLDNPTAASKDKLAAAAIINELYGEKHLIEDGVLTDKLVVNLIGEK